MNTLTYLQNMDSLIEFFTFLLGGLLIVSLLGIRSRLKSNRSSLNLPPGPWKLPLIGNIHQLFGKLPHQAMCELAKKYGPLMHLQLGEVSHVVVSSPEIAKEVMKTHDIIFASRPHIIASKIMSYDSTNIAFSPYGEYWRQLRRICNSELFSIKRVQAFRSIREEQTSDLIKWIAGNEGKPVNLSEKVYSLMYSTTAMAAFGKKNEDQESFQKQIVQATKFVAGFNIADIYPSVKFFHWISGVKPTIERLYIQTDKILEKIVNDHKTDSIAANYQELEDCKDLVDVLLKHQDENAVFHLTNDNIKAVLMDIFAGGSETSASTIDWAMSEMIKNPSIMRRAQEEVRRAFGNEAFMDEEKFDDLKYMRSVIKETLRLHPPIPLLLPRENSQRVEINGYEIPAKTKVFVNAWAINRDPAYWQDAECFRPERFLESSIDYKGRDFEYIPFGAGRRVCPGMSFGWASVQMPIAQFLYYFDWELPNGRKCEDLDMAEDFGISLTRKNDLCVIPTIHNPL